MPQLENGYLRLANELVEAYTRARIPGEAMQCLWFIIRKTYGFGKIEDKISVSQFSEATGLKKQHAHRAISKLVELNLVTKNGDGLIVSYRINKDSSSWKLLPKKVTSPKKVTGVPKKGDREYPKKVNTKETIKDIIKDIIDYLNLKTSKKFKPTTDKTKSVINARLNEGFSSDDFKKVIDTKSIQWLDDIKMNSYLRPETLFGTKFEGYLNEQSIEARDIEIIIDGVSTFMTETEYKEWRENNERV
jgi:phage replication O-like protein O